MTQDVEDFRELRRGKFMMPSDNLCRVSGMNVVKEDCHVLIRDSIYSFIKFKGGGDCGFTFDASQESVALVGLEIKS